MLDEQSIPSDLRKKPDISPELRDALMDLVKCVEGEDQSIRESSVRFWRKLENFWIGFQHIFWNESVHDWQVPDMLPLSEQKNLDMSLFERVVNIYRAHGESIIAAIAVDIPKVVFFPKNADDDDDLLTAKEYKSICATVQRENDAELLFIRGLVLMFNQGLICAYNYHEFDEKYGKVAVDTTKMEIVKTQIPMCSECGQVYEPAMMPETVTGGMIAPQSICANCGSALPPETQEIEESIPRKISSKEYPKGRESIEFFGPLHVKIPHHARHQKDCGYLLHSFEQDPALCKYIYKDIADQIPDKSSSYRYDRFARISIEYKGSEPDSLITVRKCWFRPWKFWSIKDEGARAEALKTFPSGCKVILVDEIFAECVDENLDDHWTITEDPRSSFIHADPLGKPLVPIQEVENDLFNLSLETIEHGIPFIIADPEVLDLQKYKASEVRPGNIIPGKPLPGRKYEDAFFQLKTATLSQEVKEFKATTDQMGQFVVGSMPSIWGGMSLAGSKTAAEYAMSRNQALQRLSTTYLVLKWFWVRLMGKAVRSRAENLLEDENYVERKSNSFENVWIRRANLTGKVGQVEPEPAEKFPMSWAQKRDALLELIQLKDETINSVLFDPANSEIMKQTFGFTELYIPGEADRTKQYREINDIIDGVQTMIDENIDDHMVHSEVTRLYLVSEIGDDLRKTNPEAFLMLIEHKKQHDQMIMMAQQAQVQAESKEESVGGESTEGDQNVQE